MGGLRFRQVHLDFHTSADCEPLDFEVVDGYARIALPPVGAHAVVVLE